MLVTRQGKGSKLTIQEMDGNLTYLENLSKSQIVENRVVVSSTDDLPSPVNNIIDLDTNTLYDFNGTIMIGENSLRINEGSFITGRNLSVDTILYTGTDAAIICSDTMVNINNIGIIAPNGKSMDLNMFDNFCTIFSCGFYSKDGCHITNGEVVSIKFCMFNNIPDMFTVDNHVTISGTINKLFFSECPFYPINTGQSAMILDNLTVNVIHI